MEDQKLQNIRKQFIHPESGYDCYIVLNGVGGHYCGYVRVPPEHACFGKDLNELVDITVHGGVTFAEAYQGGWLIGFDCGHWCDYIPGYRCGRPENYKELPYVEKELNRLADQLLARKGAGKIQSNLGLGIFDL